VRLRALHRDLREEGEADLLLGAERLDLLVRARLLLAELVGGEREDLEAAGLILLSE